MASLKERRNLGPKYQNRDVCIDDNHGSSKVYQLCKDFTKWQNDCNLKLRQTNKAMGCIKSAVKSNACRSQKRSLGHSVQSLRVAYSFRFNCKGVMRVNKLTQLNT